MTSILVHLEVTRTQSLAADLYDALNTGTIADIAPLLERLFQYLTYHIVPKTEREYHTIVHSFIISSGITTTVSEYPTRKGLIDIMVTLPHTVYIIEIKLNSTPQKAIAQIEERKYYEKFVHEKKRVILLGISFNITDEGLVIEVASQDVVI
jgi:hypothetical protein